jgi:Na+-transporting NADH:ubiquinone oxidoreductase subunit C
MDTNKNLYTVIYATVLVVLVAAALAFASEALKPKQQRNIEIEKKQNILKSMNRWRISAQEKPIHAFWTV